MYLKEIGCSIERWKFFFDSVSIEHDDKNLQIANSYNLVLTFKEENFLFCSMMET